MNIAFGMTDDQAVRLLGDYFKVQDNYHGEKTAHEDVHGKNTYRSNYVTGSDSVETKIKAILEPSGWSNSQGKFWS